MAPSPEQIGPTGLECIWDWARQCLYVVQRLCAGVRAQVRSQAGASVGLGCTCRYQSQLEAETKYQRFQPVHGIGFQLDRFHTPNFFSRTMILSAIAPTCHVMLSENESVCKKRPAVNSFSCKGEQVGLQQAEGTVQSTEGVEARMPWSQSQIWSYEIAWVFFK